MKSIVIAILASIIFIVQVTHCQDRNCTSKLALCPHSHDLDNVCAPKTEGTRCDAGKGICSNSTCVAAKLHGDICNSWSNGTGGDCDATMTCVLPPVGVQLGNNHRCFCNLDKFFQFATGKCLDDGKVVREDDAAMCSRAWILQFSIHFTLTAAFSVVAFYI